MRAGLVALLAVMLLAMASVIGPLALQVSQAAPQAVREAPDGDLIYRRGTMTIRLTTLACSFRGIEKLLEDEGIPPVYGYVMVQEGRPQVRGCWVRSTDPDEVLLQDMGGGDAFMPLSWFKRDPGV